MVEEDVVRRVLQALDWTSPTPPPLDERTQLVQESSSDALVRWMSGTVEEGCRKVSEETGGDMLAPWSKIRTLAHEISATFLLDLLDVPAPPEEVRGRLERELAVDIVARDVTVTGVIAALRVLQDLWLTQLVQAALSVTGGSDALPRLMKAVSGAVDAAVDRLVTAISQERRVVLQQGRATTRATIEGLVSGELPDEQVTSASLGIDMGGWHVGCVLHAPAGASVTRSEVDAAVASFAEVSGGGPLVRHETSSGQVWLWASGDHTIGVRDSKGLRIDAPLVIGLGEPREGLTGFRRTHIEAVESLRVGLMSSSKVPVTRYRDVGLEALLSRDLEQARWYVDSELNGLAADTAEMAELRQTLRVYFAARMRIAPAAEQLFIHRNSLRDRLRRIEDILGYQLADRSADCQAALRLSDLI
ncbi:PucR family transcriptional regulator [Kribbia dieselivorans]|uniref:PucR family transcriptional regulator n=1 Tax=Kribbia dieselivorans TaxID=331526 RepID=UPI000837AAD9|nr:helix-turn-helix domain-containing protein [Kribbia dieselivorans]